MSITDTLFHPVVHALSWAVIHSLWQLTLLLVMWRVALLLARKGTPVLRYKLSMLALLIIPLSFGWTFTRQYQVYSRARQIVSVEFDASAWIAAAGDRAFYILDRAQPGFLQGVESYTPLVFNLYVAGLLAVALVTLTSYLRLYRLRSRGSRELPAEWRARSQKLIRLAGIRGKSGLRLSDRLDVPLVIGFLKPMVLLPTAMLFAMHTDQVESIILHELCHIRRRDHLVNALQILLEVFFFYHPATWWISRTIRKLREEAVDQWVVAQTGEPLVYSRALLSLEEQRQTRLPLHATAATRNPNHLFTRIKQLMTMKTQDLNTGTRMAALLAVVFALACVAWVKPNANFNLFDQDTQQLAYLAPAHGPAEAEADHTGAKSGERQAGERSTTGDGVSQLSKHGEDNGSFLLAGLGDMLKDPLNVYLHDGTYIKMQDLSEQEQEAIREAMEELRKAMEEVDKEVFEWLRSEEFRAMMQEAGNGARLAGEEMEKAGEEIRKAMEELQRQMQDEEFRQEMRQAGEELRKAMKEMEDMDWEGMGDEFRQAMQEFSKGMSELNEGMQHLGPMIQGIMEGVAAGMEGLDIGMEGLGKGLEGLGPALEEMMKELQQMMKEVEEKAREEE